MEVYKIIKERRLALGLTLKDVAVALGVAESTVSRYESTEIKNMGIDKIEALANVLKCEPGYLMGWQKAPFDKKSADILADAMEDERLINALDLMEKLDNDKKDDVLKYIRFISQN